MTENPDLEQFSERFLFEGIVWASIPAEPGVYVIYDLEELVYVGMAGRNGRGSLRNRLRDHSTGQIVNMFAQYLFLARVQFLPEKPITHPRDAKSACKAYISKRCSFQYVPTPSAEEARSLESRLKSSLRPAFNP